jgi:hypothetical protein
MAWVVNVTPRPTYPQERPGTHCIRGWMGPRARREGCGKISPPPGFDPRTAQPIASRYTDGAIPAHHKFGIRKILIINLSFKFAVPYMLYL